jgi:hypothetical protein
LEEKLGIIAKIYSLYHLVLELGLETSTLSSCADMTAKQTQLVHPTAEL